MPSRLIFQDGRHKTEGNMETFSYTPLSLTRNGQPWFPVMGEIHFSRVHQSMWHDNLLKMKAGGVDIAASYVIWIHHEEKEGEWDFTGQRDLRAFIKEVQRVGLYFILRIGPWSHAEVRNGGFPDWLKHKGFTPRTNDERYFAQVRKLYEKIYSQVSDLLLKNGGPIIGVQIENEYGHCGGLKGEEGVKHMQTLGAMAREIGFDVPIYTTTGWGGAITAGFLPVMGGYCDAPWDPRTIEIEPSGNYTITHERNDHGIGSDFGEESTITFDPSKYPYLTAELGGGLQPTYLRHVMPSSTDEGAMTLTKIASGCSLLGYYMYSGGANPYGKYSTLQEFTNTGSHCDLLESSYDFFAPVGEYGKINDTYRELKLFALFAHDFGNTLQKPIIPDNSPLMPSSRDMRYSVRKADGASYLFVNNYVRHQVQNDRPGWRFDWDGVYFPPIDVHNGDYYILPFNMNVGNGCIRSALVSPLCILHDNTDGRSTYVFYKTAACPGHNESELINWEREPTDASVLIIERDEALNAYKVSRDGVDYLVLFDGSLVDDGVSLEFTGEDVSSFKTYPALPAIPDGCECTVCDDSLTEYLFDDCVDYGDCFVSVIPLGVDGTKKTFQLSIDTPNDLDEIMENCNSGDGPVICDTMLTIRYNGNNARLLPLDTPDKLAADNLFCSKSVPWKIGLRELWTRLQDSPTDFLLEIYGVHDTDAVYFEDKPRFNHAGIACDFIGATTMNEYRAKVYF